MSSSSARANDQSLIDTIENLREDDEIEVDCIDQTLAIVSKDSVLPGQQLPEIRLEASDGTVYDLRQSNLNQDLIEIEPRQPLSDPRVVRELEVVNQ